MGSGFNEQKAFSCLEELFPRGVDRPEIKISGSDFEFRTTRGPEARDDCSVTEIKLGEMTMLMVQTTDFVRGMGFQLAEEGYMKPYDVGWYLAGANLSDIAASGAQPATMNVVYRYPKGSTEEDFAQFMEGAQGCLSKYGEGAQVVGGDTGSYDSYVASADVTGFTAPGRLLTQSGAKPGHVVALTGPTGLAATARLVASGGLVSPGNTGYYTESFERWTRVHPRVAAGLAITEVQGLGGGTDTSDGLKVAAENIARKSEVNIQLNPDVIPIHPEVARAARELGHEAPIAAMVNSVDFELLVTIDPDNISCLRERFAARGLKELQIIGTVMDPEGDKPCARFIDGTPLIGQIETHAA